MPKNLASVAAAPKWLDALPVVIMINCLELKEFKWLFVAMIFPCHIHQNLLLRPSKREIFFFALFLVKSLTDFVGELEEERFLCPVITLRFFFFFVPLLTFARSPLLCLRILVDELEE